MFDRRISVRIVFEIHVKNREIHNMSFIIISRNYRLKIKRIDEIQGRGI